MLFKLALKNMKKSIKDYSIYFFTLVFSVAIFYIFNSLDSQSVVLELMGCKNETIQLLVQMLGYVSIVVSVILGFLIIYANNFLIKRRKKEIGLYMTLGMGKREVSKILVIETVLIGIVSLAVGLLAGIGLGQLISIVAVKLLATDMSSYQFAFSQNAFIKSIVYFAIIFVLVMIFNVFVLNKYKLIDLLYGAKKNEKVKIKGRVLTFIIFAAAMGILGYAYYLLFHGALSQLDGKFGIMLACGCVGTFLFFLSLSGFLLRVIELNKNVYYKGLNMFVLKQVNSKVNTTVFSTTIICLLLLFTIGILACSMSLASVFNASLNNSNLSDYTINDHYIRYVYDENNDIQVKSYSVDLSAIQNNDTYKSIADNSQEMDVYYFDEVTPRTFLSDSALQKVYDQFGTDMVDVDDKLPVYSVSQYNALMELYGKEDYEIKDSNTYLFTCNIEAFNDFFKDEVDAGKKLNINGKEYSIAKNEIVDMAFMNSNGTSNGGTVILPDEAFEGKNPVSANLIGNYKSDVDKKESEDKMIEYMKTTNDSQNHGMIMTKLEMEESSISVKVMVIFVGVYLGIVFAITSATIIAIQQLSESSDNAARYKILREIGADQKMINKSLFTQIGICFMIPLVVAIFHAYFGLREITNLIQVLGNMNLGTNILITAAFVVLIYGGYFLATYLCSKKIISEE